MFPPDVADQLAKLIPLLASDKDGEVVATVRAIGRTLEAAGADLHGLAAAVTRRRIEAGDRPISTSHDYGGFGFNYADTFKEAAPSSSAPLHPEGLSSKFGLPLFWPNHIEPWWEVGRYCLRLNRSIPKRYGGKFLRDFEIKILNGLVEGQRTPTNAQASWLETVVARCHQARDAERRAQEGRANG